MKNVCFLLLLMVLIMSGCGRKPICGLDGFSKISTLTVNDTIELEDKDILNPHYIYYKDSFLIFNSMRGEREIQLLNLHTDRVTSYNVIGQGVNEMTGYQTIRTNNENLYLFGDYRTGKIYGVCLDSLKKDPDTNYELCYSLPVERSRFFFRFLDMSKYVLGIGMIENGRFSVFDKESDYYSEQMNYPENKEISNLNHLLKGALFSRTLMVCDEKEVRIVASGLGVMDFYSISEHGELSLIKANHYHFPLFETGANGSTIIYHKEDKVGFSGLCADKNYVYALYSDRTVGEYGERAYNASYLLVWDWEGNPVNAYELPVALYGFAIDGDTIYGLSREESPVVFVLKMESSFID